MASILPRWMEWAREIQAISQTGSFYAENEYQRQRYRRLTEIAAEIISEHTQLECPELVDLFIHQIGYATPRVDVRGAVFSDGKILLVRERTDGGWTMPGGWADVGDVPSEAAEREVLEESGFQVRAIKVIGVYDANRSYPLEIFHAFKIVFLCNILGGDAQTSIETSEVKFFGQNEIPAQFSGERTRHRHVVDAFAVHEDNQSSTVFD
jgi:ADP-ribose pyrophosphatase YjhB (NUDIX family)